MPWLWVSNKFVNIYAFSNLFFLSYLTFLKALTPFITAVLAAIESSEHLLGPERDWFSEIFYGPEVRGFRIGFRDIEAI